MYKWLQSNNGTFHPRKHPTKQSHELWQKIKNNNGKLISGFLYFNEEWNTESPSDDIGIKL